jgi:hypothetical protein
LIKWFFEPESPLGGTAGTGNRNALEGCGLSRDEKIVRETIQNIADALAEGSQRSKVVFRIVKLKGAAKEAFIAASQLGSMVAERGDALGLPAVVDTEFLNNPDIPLPLLYIEDSGTTGLQGEEHRKGDSSDFFRFVYLYGDEEKAASGGLSLGSYGLGKSVLSSASSLYAFFVHSVIGPETVPGVSVRTIGCGLYRPHSHNGQNFGGRAWLGDTEDTTIAPVSSLKNDMAVELARQLGFSQRSSDQTGTSICIIGLDAKAQDYVDAINKYWWPRIIRQTLQAEVIDENGETLRPRPRQHPQLKKYIEAYDLAIGNDEPSDEDSKVQRFRETHLGMKTGVLAAKRGFPMEASEEPHELDNKVALLRQKGMVVDYLHVPTSTSQRWYGVFLADEECDDLLKLSEPPAHNKWDSGSTRLINKYGEKGQLVVETIYKRTRDNIRKWFNTARVVAQPDDQRIRRLDEIFGKPFAAPGERPARPEPNPAPIHLTGLEGKWHPEGDFAWMSATPTLRLKDDHETETLTVNISAACRICEDVDQRPGEAVPIWITCETQEQVHEYQVPFTMTLTKHQPVNFEVRTAKFDARLLIDWRMEVTPV